LAKVIIVEMLVGKCIVYRCGSIADPFENRLTGSSLGEMTDAVREVLRVLVDARSRHDSALPHILLYTGYIYIYTYIDVYTITYIYPTNLVINTTWLPFYNARCIIVLRRLAR
jgi:hypothetical protein